MFGQSRVRPNEVGYEFFLCATAECRVTLASIDPLSSLSVEAHMGGAIFL